MDIIPVLDLQAGVVVRGVAGKRSEYCPIESRLVKSARPGEVAAALVKEFGFQTAYVADLDAIGGAQPDWAAYQAIAEAGLRLWIDAGVCDATAAVELAAQRYCDAVVIGLETLPSFDRLAECVERLGSERVIFSLDLMNGQPRTQIAALEQTAPLEIARRAVQAGVRRMIVLDLAAVGVNAGPVTLELGRELRAAFAERKPMLIGGGGVRDAADLAALEAAGYDAALVASALHDGRLSPDLRPRS
jgi:phosphoribosylformimino-5-aminoimidazole carboxamide ribotide isomerase